MVQFKRNNSDLYFTAGRLEWLFEIVHEIEGLL
jgi:hypothetical protein